MKRIRDNITIKKIIAIILLVACGIFLAANNSSLLNKKIYVGSDKVSNSRPNIAARSGTSTSMLGNAKVGQSFIAEHGRISVIDIAMANPGRYNATGDVKVYIADKDSKIIASAQLPINMVSNASWTSFSFNGDTKEINEREVVSDNLINHNKKGVKITEGASYTLYVESVDVKSDSEVSLLSNQASGEKILNVKTYLAFSTKIFVAFYILLLGALIIVLMPWRSISKRFERFNVNRLAMGFIFFITPFVCFFTLFKIDGKRTGEVFQFLQQLNGQLNLFLIVLVWWIIFTIINRFGLTSILTQLFCFVFAYANYILIIFRDTPLIYNDLFLWKTAVGVAKSYTLTFNKSCIWAIVVTIVWIALILAFANFKSNLNSKWSSVKNSDSNFELILPSMQLPWN